MFIGIIRSIFCRHRYEVVRNAKGEMVLHFDGISEWKCRKCGCVTYSQHMDRVK